jgi:hypothetical protein
MSAEAGGIYSISGLRALLPTDLQGHLNIKLLRGLFINRPFCINSLGQTTKRLQNQPRKPLLFRAQGVHTSG